MIIEAWAKHRSWFYSAGIAVLITVWLLTGALGGPQRAPGRALSRRPMLRAMEQHEVQPLPAEVMEALLEARPGRHLHLLGGVALADHGGIDLGDNTPLRPLGRERAPHHGLR